MLMLMTRPFRQSLAFVTLFALSLFPHLSQAAPGDLDPSFGVGGKVITDFGYATAVAIQADGKIVAAGIFDQSPFSVGIGLVRYNTDGSLDTGYGTGGRGINRLRGRGRPLLPPAEKAAGGGGFRRV